MILDPPEAFLTSKLAPQQMAELLTYRPHEWNEKAQDKYSNRRVPKALEINQSAIGDGKTYTTLRAIRDMLDENQALKITIFASTVELCKEIVAKLQTLGVAAERWLPRDEPHPDIKGAYLCPFYEDIIKPLREARGNADLVCASQETKCEYEATCQIRQQRLKSNALRDKSTNPPRPVVQVATHTMMHHPMPHRGVFDVVVYDESIISTLLQSTEGTIERVLNPSLASALDDQDHDIFTHIGILASTVEGIKNQLYAAVTSTFERDNRHLRRADLPSLGELEVLYAAYGVLIGKTRKVTSKHVVRDRKGVAKELKAEAARAKPLLDAQKILKALMRSMVLMDSSDEFLPGVTLTKELHGSMIRVFNLTPPHKDYQAELNVLLSSTTSPNLYLGVFDNVPEPTRIKPKPAPHATIHRVRRVTGSKSSLYKKEGKKITLKESGKAALDFVIEKASGVRPDEYKGNHAVLVVMPKDLEDYVVENKLFPKRLQIATAHFNALAGLNKYKNVRLLIVIGRPLPPVEVLEQMSEAITGKHISPATNWMWKPNLEQQAKNGDIFETKSPVHEDQVVLDLLSEITLGQIAQSNRARGQHRDANHPVDIYYWHDLPSGGLLPIEDDVVHLARNGWYQLMARKGVVLRLSEGVGNKGQSALIAALLPEKFFSPQDRGMSEQERRKRAAKAVENHRAKRKARLGETNAELDGTHGFTNAVPMHIKLPHSRYKVEVEVDATNRAEARNKLELLIASNAHLSGAHITGSNKSKRKKMQNHRRAKSTSDAAQRASQSDRPSGEVAIPPVVHYADSSTSVRNRA